MNWNQLAVGDTIVGNISLNVFTLVKRAPSARGSEWLRLTMLDHEQGELFVNEIVDQSIHFFTVYKANGDATVRT